MIISVKECIENAYKEYPTIKRTTWVQKWPGQCVLCVTQMYWTAEVHDVFNAQEIGKIGNYHMFLTVLLITYFKVYDIFTQLNIVLESIE